MRRRLRKKKVWIPIAAVALFSALAAYGSTLPQPATKAAPTAAKRAPSTTEESGTTAPPVTTTAPAAVTQPSVATTTAAPTTTAAAPTTNASPPPSKPKWAGRTETAYVSNFETCALFTVHEIARQEHVKGEAVTLALHLADGYQPWAHQAAFEGCLDGIPNSWYRYNDRKLYPANVTDRQIRKLTAAGYTASL